MAKILLDTEMAEIIYRSVHEDLIDDGDQYSRFLADLAGLICDHFGGVPGGVGEPDSDLGWTVGFHWNECLPDDGGVFKDYDTDVTWTCDGEVD